MGRFEYCIAIHFFASDNLRVMSTHCDRLPKSIGQRSGRNISYSITHGSCSELDRTIGCHLTSTVKEPDAFEVDGELLTP